ncbi:MAG: hypothetical protein RLZZ308_98 [Candidatus Parcubacteria bacterium]|jgi:hypothetical protein
MAKGSATQQFVPIDKVRDGIIVLKTGELRAILITNSLNLGLKSEDELTAVISQFQNFLNSLDFPVQFFIESRKLHIAPYLNLLQERSKLVKEDLLKIQIHEYIGFIQKFTEESNIMTKHFFISVPYYVQTNTQASSPSPIDMLSSLAVGQTTRGQQDPFELSRIQLEQRIAVIIQGLSRFGIRAQKLDTEELVELFYKLFNPSDDAGHAPKLQQS